MRSEGAEEIVASFEPAYIDTHKKGLLKKKVEEGNLGFKTGKGFQEWTPEEVQKSRKRLQEYLLEVNKRLPRT